MQRRLGPPKITLERDRGLHCGFEPFGMKRVRSRLKVGGINPPAPQLTSLGDRRRKSMKINNKSLSLLTIGVVFVCVIGILDYHAVDNSLSEEDKEYIPKYLRNITPLPEIPSYDDELNYIISVQRSVLNIAPHNNGLPFNQKREPKELYVAKTGLCYDKSRVIEKILRYSGFETRHVFILSTKNTGSAVKSLITPSVSSHAVTEVLTKEGWLVVDSMAPWVSTDKNNHPVSIEKIQSKVELSEPIEWSSEPPMIYTEPFTFVYGLYSRHGMFYPPYNFIPDVNYGELVQNI